MNSPTIHVACLCAAWCRLCDDYVSVIEQISHEPAAAGATVVWHWIDIEDESALVGDLDVETFPTLVIVDPTQVRFAGPLAPQPDTLRRLLRSTVHEADADARWPAVAPEVAAFAARLRARDHA